MRRLGGVGVGDPRPAVRWQRRSGGEAGSGRHVPNPLPDWHSELHLLIAEGGLVAGVFTATGTHRGEVMGVAPTGQEISFRGINVFRIHDGRISDRWGRLDDLGFLQQLGLAPRTGT